MSRICPACLKPMADDASAGVSRAETCPACRERLWTTVRKIIQGDQPEEPAVSAALG